MIINRNRYRFGDILEEVSMPIKMDDNQLYNLASIKRRNGGLVDREKKKGKDILTKTLSKLIPGSFVISKMQVVHGACAMVPIDIDEKYISASYVSFLPRDTSIIDIGYLNAYSHTRQSYDSFFRSSHGVHIEKMTFKVNQWLKEEIELPSLTEQKKIVKILSAIDKEISNISSKIKQINHLSTAITKKLFRSVKSDFMLLSEVSNNHDSLRVPIKSEERLGRIGPYRYFGASGVIDRIDDYLFDGNYILIGEDGANIIERNKPLAFKVSGKFWVNNHAHVIQPNNLCDINYLTHYLESLDYKSIAAGSAQPKITRSALNSIRVPIPSLDSQKKIGAAIESTLNVSRNLKEKKKKLIDLKYGISNDLLTGKIKVNI
tara:strand:+ start:1244 stop:2371 length:1128 start_codon:yes stop_codon:yes gene_type:complete